MIITMVDPWETVDLTLTCEIGDEPPLSTGAYRFFSKSSGHASSMVPTTLADKFTEIYLSRRRRSSKQENHMEDMKMHQRDDAKSSCLVEVNKKVVKNHSIGVFEEVIIIDDSSSDDISNDSPDARLQTGIPFNDAHSQHHSPETFSIETSPDSSPRRLVIASPEPEMTIKACLPGSHQVERQSHPNIESPTRYSSNIETDGIIVIDSDEEPEDFQTLTQTPRDDIGSQVVDYHKIVTSKSKSKTQTTRSVIYSSSASSNSCDPSDRVFYQCTSHGCAFYFKTLPLLQSHSTKRHNVLPKYYYEFVLQHGRPSDLARYVCFICDFTGEDEEAIKRHADEHSSENMGPSVTVDAGKKNLEDCNVENRLASPEVDSTKGSKSILPVSISEDNASPLENPMSPSNLASDSSSNELVDTPKNVNADDQEKLLLSEDMEIENAKEASDSDNDSDNQQGQSPHIFHCLYCDHTTIVEEWYHKHVATHLPDSKPYSRLYCTECTYSTGLEKFLLFHMTAVHVIRNPEYYRSGEKMYTCRYCRQTKELRIDMEHHIKEKHQSLKKTFPLKCKDTRTTMFKCSQKGCTKYFKRLPLLQRHTNIYHNIKFLQYFYESVQNNLRLVCFHCNKTLTEKKLATHFRDHLSAKQRRAPYVYKCPLESVHKNCGFSCKNARKLLEHYRKSHQNEVQYYKQLNKKYACLNCPFSASSQSLAETHCTQSCKYRDKKKNFV